jgi:hypothetical protein
MRTYYIVEEENRNILHRIKRRKAKWIGHILRRNCLLEHKTEGKTIEKMRKTTYAATG